MSNPYESPQYAGGVVGLGDDREKLRRVARYQQWVLKALLANIAINVLIFLAAVGARFQTLYVVLWVSGLVVALAGLVAIYLLANEIYNVVVGVICAVLMLVPCISLITLLVVNSKATSYLQQRGVKVGLMGANPDLI